MACSVVLAGIPSDCEVNKGGIQNVWIANYNAGDFTVSAATSGDTAEYIVSIDASATWYKYNFKKGVCTMTSTLNVDQANGINYVSTELMLQFSKMDAAKRMEIAALSLGELEVVVKDNNGKYWAMGVSEPVLATAGTAQTGAAKTDGNFYQITLSVDEDSYLLPLTDECAGELPDNI